MSKRAIHFTQDHVGCWADGAVGHGHIREVLANMVEACDWDLSQELRKDMSDDAWEEDTAIELLNEHCADGVSFGLRDGDLMLLTDEQWSED